MNFSWIITCTTEFLYEHMGMPLNVPEAASIPSLVVTAGYIPSTVTTASILSIVVTATACCIQ